MGWRMARKKRPGYLVLTKYAQLLDCVDSATRGEIFSHLTAISAALEEGSQLPAPFQSDNRMVCQVVNILVSSLVSDAVEYQQEAKRRAIATRATFYEKQGLSKEEARQRAVEETESEEACQVASASICDQLRSNAGNCSPIQSNPLSIRSTAFYSHLTTSNDIPSLSEVLQFAQTEHLQLDAEKWYKAAVKNGWRDDTGKPIRSWQGLLRSIGRTKTVSAQRCDQRPLTEADLDGGTAAALMREASAQQEGAEL